ncbi:hypothetical protein [Fodinicola acaciae]|uniref:hypothetical protein n=1 Tax=Fodinicola acaciae TaxID=2681555 RepID=UPI0013D65346|nr:hypothetical protein [Fodinicola acaciae]
MPIDLLLVYVLTGVLMAMVLVGLSTVIAMAVSYLRRRLEWHRLTSIDVATPERLHMHGGYGPARPAGDVDPMHRGELPSMPGADILLDGFGQPHGFPVRRRRRVSRMP